MTSATDSAAGHDPTQQPEPSPQAAPDSAQELANLARQITRLEEIASDWDEHYRGTLQATKSAIEELNREAFRRLIQVLRQDPASAANLRQAVQDPFIYGVLRFHKLVREPLTDRVAEALQRVRPALEDHGGNVELIAIKPPDTVEIRLLGACQGCPASSQTFTEGIEREIRELCPEIQHIVQVGGSASPAPGEQALHFVSPFAASPDAAWTTLCPATELSDGERLTRRLESIELLLCRDGDVIYCCENACAHMGLALEDGAIANGVLSCPHHGFSYELSTGACRTVADVRLPVFPTRIHNGQIQVRLKD